MAINQCERQADGTAIGHLPVEEFLTRLAARQPTPAGGAAAAVTAAQSAALLAMSARATQSRKKTPAELLPMLTQMIGEADARQSALLDLADADCRAFDDVLAAARLPLGDRRDRLIAAYQPIVDIPLSVVDACLATLRGVAALTPICHPHLLGDARAAAHLAHAAALISLGNARINVRGLRGLTAQPAPPIAAGQTATTQAADEFVEAATGRLQKAESILAALVRQTLPNHGTVDAQGWPDTQESAAAS